MVPPILDIGGVLISGEILSEYFACDLAACRGACCVEGDAGAPVAPSEVGALREAADAAWPLMSASAQSVVDRQGVVYTDVEGELVTSIVRGRECVFVFNGNINDNENDKGGCYLCAMERVWRSGGCSQPKPISCALYPIREKHFDGGLVGLNLHHWDICRAAFERGRREGIRVYEFLREPLIRRFGQAWYDELVSVAQLIDASGSVDA